MSFGGMQFSLSYSSQENDIVQEFLLPALKEGVEYDRAVGFFSSSSLLSISVGIKNLVKNNGKIKIICSPKLSEQDINAIAEGYEKRQIIENALEREFVEAKNKFEEERFNMLSHLIEKGILDIKIATMKSDNPNAMFHAKLGIIKDEVSNFIAFTGSMNESHNAFYENEETIDVYSSLSSDYLRANEKLEYFNRLWDGEENKIEILEFPKALKNKIDIYKKDEIDWDVDKKEIDAKKRKNKINKPEIPKWLVVRDYQKKA